MSYVALPRKNDTRFLVRGRIDWEELESWLRDNSSFESRIYRDISVLINTRRKYKHFGAGGLEWLEFMNRGNRIDELLSFYRTLDGDRLLILNNLSDNKITVDIPEDIKACIAVNSGDDFDGNDHRRLVDLLNSELRINGDKQLVLEHYGYHWIRIDH